MKENDDAIQANTNSLNDLLTKLRSAFKNRDNSNNDRNMNIDQYTSHSTALDHYTVQNIQKILTGYSGKDWISVLQNACEENYTNLSDEKYNYGKVWINEKTDPFLLGIYAWRPNSKTPFHDHGDRACAFYLAIGEDTRLQNEAYDKDLTNLTEFNNLNIQNNDKKNSRLLEDIALLTQTRSISVLSAGECAILWEHQAHRISNLHGDKMSFSIHLYVPKFEQCRIWEEVTSNKAIIH